MKIVAKTRKFDYLSLIAICLVILISTLVLSSIAKFIFPTYFLYIFLSIIAFYIFSNIDFDILSLFSKHVYVASIIFLVLPIIIGQVTRGAIRWIPLGPLSIQPSEIVRPFLLIFFAGFLTQKELTVKRFITAVFLLLLPVIFIFIQPSLGVAVLTIVGFAGVLIASSFQKKYILLGISLIAILLPIIWAILAPYQKLRLVTFLQPSADPLGAGYNSIQSMISVGSGKILGRGLGKGVQTQLAFLPERHTDFIFASIAEELGSIGAVVVVLGLFIILWRITVFIETANDETARGYLIGVFFVLLAECIIHIGMNMGLLPITGLPLPLVSAGGSSFLATMTALGICQTAKKLD